MIDKLNLTTFRAPDYDYLNYHGDYSESLSKSKLYKYMWKLEDCVVMCKPHKFSREINDGIPYTKIDINPKYFECYLSMWGYIDAIFNEANLRADEFNVSRIDLAEDVPDVSSKSFLSVLRVQKISFDSFRVQKGTIYIGKNPEIVIYDKIKEIRSRLKRGGRITDYEEMLLNSGKEWMRFEIRKKPEKMSLQYVVDHAASLAPEFDRLEMFKFNGEEMTGIMHVIYGLINRKNRKELDHFKDSVLIDRMKENFIASVTDWFDLNGKRQIEPF